MKVKNKKTGTVLTTTQFEFDQTIVRSGKAYLYEIVEDDTPVEIRSMRTLKDLKNQKEKK